MKQRTYEAQVQTIREMNTGSETNQGSTALKTDVILSWTSLIDSGTLPEITVSPPTIH